MSLSLSSRRVLGLSQLLAASRSSCSLRGDNWPSHSDHRPRGDAHQDQQYDYRQTSEKNSNISHQRGQGRRTSERIEITPSQTTDALEKIISLQRKTTTKNKDKDTTKATTAMKPIFEPGKDAGSIRNERPTLPRSSGTSSHLRSQAMLLLGQRSSVGG